MDRGCVTYESCSWWSEMDLAGLFQYIEKYRNHIRTTGKIQKQLDRLENDCTGRNIFNLLKIYIQYACWYVHAILRARNRNHDCRDHDLGMDSPYLLASSSSECRVMIPAEPFVIFIKDRSIRFIFLQLDKYIEYIFFEISAKPMRSPCKTDEHRNRYWILSHHLRIPVLIALFSLILR